MSFEKYLSKNKKDCKYFWSVYEDNAGGLYLEVMKDDNIVGLFDGYEYRQGCLVNDILALYNSDEDVENWEKSDNVNGIKEVINDVSTKLIADSNGVYYDVMGHASKLEFENFKVKS